MDITKQSKIKISPGAYSPGITEKEKKPMFKKFIEEIIACKDQQEAWDKVFYGTVYENGKIKKYGIDIAYQHEKISAKEHELLATLIKKMA